MPNPAKIHDTVHSHFHRNEKGTSMSTLECMRQLLDVLGDSQEKQHPEEPPLALVQCELLYFIAQKLETIQEHLALLQSDIDALEQGAWEQRHTQ